MKSQVYLSNTVLFFSLVLLTGCGTTHGNASVAPPSGGNPTGGNPAQSYTAVVDPGTQYQTMEGWGTTLSWWANQVGGWSEPARSQLVDQLFAAPPNGLGLTYARYNIGGGDCPTCKTIPSGNAVPGYQPTPGGPFDWTVDGNQRWVAQRAYQDGAVFFEGQSNSPPWWMTISGSSTGGVGGAPNLSSAYQGTDANSFPNYLVTVAEHFDQDFGITFREIDPFNEPDGNWWKYGSTKQERCAFGLAQQEAVIQSTNTLLNQAGSITRIAVNDDNSIGDTVNDVGNFDSQTVGDIDEVNTHAYGSSGKSSSLSTAVSSAGKRMVMSEWGSAETTGKDLSTHLVTGINSLHAVDWAIWQPDWPPLFTINYSAQTSSPTEVYYVYANYTEFIRPGDTILSINDANSVAAYNGRNNTLTIVTYNWTSSDTVVTYDLSRFKSVGPSASVYRTSSSEKLASLGSVSLSGTSLVYTAKPGSVTTLVIPNTVYSPSIQSETQATLNAGQNSYYTVPFNGTQARVYGSMGPSQGILAYSVDGGAETDVDLYASTSTENVLVYATPTLPAGSHVLKVRVTGLKNSHATNFTGQSNQVEIVN